MAINKFIFILLVIGIYTDHPQYKDELTCGKKDPKKPKDCTKYGTGSGLLCCWVADSESSNSGRCFLLPQTMAEKYGIKGDKTFPTSEQIDKNTEKSNYFWSCGNKSFYLTINLMMILFILLSL